MWANIKECWAVVSPIFAGLVIIALIAECSLLRQEIAKIRAVVPSETRGATLSEQVEVLVLEIRSLQMDVEIERHRILKNL